MLGQIEADRGNLHETAPLSVAFFDNHVLGAMTPGAGAALLCQNRFISHGDYFILISGWCPGEEGRRMVHASLPRRRLNEERRCLGFTQGTVKMIVAKDYNRLEQHCAPENRYCHSGVNAGPICVVM